MNYNNYKESCTLVVYIIKLYETTRNLKKTIILKKKYFSFEQKLNWGTNNAMFYLVNS